MEKFYCTDCHCDSILSRVREDKSMFNAYNTSKEHGALQLFACFLEDYHKTIKPELCAKYSIDENDYWGFLMKFFDCFEDEVAKHPDFVLVKSLEDINNARAAGKNMAVLSIEGSKMIDSLEKLHICYERGLRVMTLTWNPSNSLACGSDATVSGNDTGLSSLGKEIVKEAGKLGIILDLAHTSDKTARDILEVNDLPVMASHSNYRSVCNHQRNLPKDISDEIVRRGGYIGLNLCHPFIKENMGGDTYNMEKILPHIEYALEQGYAKNIGFGCDIDGIDIYPNDIDMTKSIHDQIVAFLLSRGYGEEFVRDFAYRNFFSLIERYVQAI